MRAPPVAVSAQQREVTTSEKEGPSKVVLMHEPVEKIGEKVVKKEVIKEEWIVEENLTVSMTEAIPKDLPPATKTEEVLVKEEWVELCE